MRLNRNNSHFIVHISTNSVYMRITAVRLWKCMCVHASTSTSQYIGIQRGSKNIKSKSTKHQTSRRMSNCLCIKKSWSNEALLFLNAINLNLPLICVNPCNKKIHQFTLVNDAFFGCDKKYVMIFFSQNFAIFPVNLQNKFTNASVLLDGKKA